MALALIFMMGGLAHAKVKGADAKAIKQISEHFSGVPSMMGEFIQFGPNGEQTGGKFFLQRPGKIRFDYSKPSPITVKADGRTVGINNKKLKTWDYFPLRKTPLRLLLADKIDVDVRQWTITDNQGKDTSVMIFNTKKNVKFKKRFFKIDHNGNARTNNDR